MLCECHKPGGRGQRRAHRCGLGGETLLGRRDLELAVKGPGSGCSIKRDHGGKQKVFEEQAEHIVSFPNK